MLARFLNFYPQYKLSDLREMPVSDFYFLLTGMMDIQAPDLTDPIEELVQKRMREAMEGPRALGRARRRR